MILNFDTTLKPEEVETHILSQVDTDELKQNLAVCEAECAEYYETEDDGPNVWYSKDVALLDDPIPGRLSGYSYGITMLDRFLEHFNFRANLEGNTVHVIASEDALFEISDALQAGFVTENNVILWVKFDEGLKVWSVVTIN